jgi:hypothetical protein
VSLKLPGMELSENIRQADILRIVRERLAGFKTRQKIRELRRLARRKPKQKSTVATQKGLFE